MISGEQFRKAVGYGVIKSTRFTQKNSKNEISFSGSGNGHGVGLCQWGAKQRALDGCRDDIEAFRARQSAAFDEERRAWAESGELS